MTVNCEGTCDSRFLDVTDDARQGAKWTAVIIYAPPNAITSDPLAQSLERFPQK